MGPYRQINHRLDAFISSRVEPKRSLLPPESGLRLSATKMVVHLRVVLEIQM